MPLDRRSRPLRALRLSVTDRCNLRCQYCMPESKYDWVPRGELLTFEELSRVVDRFIALGVRKVRLTGGEPLLRADLPALVKTLAGKALDELALTTNGVLLRTLAQPLFDALNNVLLTHLHVAQTAGELLLLAPKIREFAAQLFNLRLQVEKALAQQHVFVAGTT